MERSKWFERRFTFDYPEGWLFNIVERLRGTPVRLREFCKDLDHNQLTARPEGQWSIQEHVGHLLDLEALFEGRIDDLIARRENLRAADLTNAQTHAANHNAVPLSDLVQGFQTARERFIQRLLDLDDDTQHYRALHPRLQMLMRPVDVAFFSAEHDDHHLAAMRALV